MDRRRRRAKTKPTQQSVRELSSLGVQPEVLLCRCDRPLPESDREKIALFCNVRKSAVIPALDARNIYDVPLQYHEAGLDDEVLYAFGIADAPRPELARWREIMDRIDHYDSEVTIGVVGKYVGLPDAYKSLREALGPRRHRQPRQGQDRVDRRGGLRASRSRHRCRARAAARHPRPGGFGERGSEGKIASVKFARERDIPFFGICLGMQMACIEGARNLAGIAGASTTEFGETSEPVVGMITEWMSEEGLQQRAAGGDLGGTMRLGAYPAKLDGNSVVRSIYGDRRYQRASPSPLRGQRPLSRRAGERRPDVLGHVA